jgi:hypothetical protein
MVLPGCQDTGTATVIGKRGGRVLTPGGDEAALSRGVFRAYTETNLRYSQVGGCLSHYGYGVVMGEEGRSHIGLGRGRPCHPPAWRWMRLRTCTGSAAQCMWIARFALS